MHMSNEQNTYLCLNRNFQVHTNITQLFFLQINIDLYINIFREWMPGMDSIVYDQKRDLFWILDSFCRSPLLNAEILESFEPLDSWSRVALNRERDKPIRPLAGKYDTYIN